MSEPRLIPLRDPRTGAPDGAIEAPNDAAFDALCARLRAAQPAWAALPIKARAEALLALRTAIAGEADAIAEGLERDTGRRAIAKTEVNGVLGALAGWAGQAAHLVQADWVQGRSAPHLKHAPNFKPYPLVGVISPWNFPLTLAMIDTVPALLAGCAVIVKPSEVTPRFINALRRAVALAPDVAKVLAFVDGDGATGAGLCARADAICFTGSVATGRKVALACAERLIPAFLELGGKDPLIVLDSAPLDHAVTAALRGSVLATGQACQSIERIYVARTLYRAFIEKLATAAAAAPLNWPDIAAGQVGPLIFAKQAEIIAAQLQDAYAKGARALTGGAIESHGGGLWLKPTVLVGVTHDMAIMREETFGPVMPVMAFDSTDEAVALANDSVFGLSGAVFAGTLAQAEAVARRLECGAVSLNDAALTALFYEAEKNSFKQSGLGGSRMGLAGFQRFLRRQALIANTAAPTPLSAFAENG